MDPLNAEEERLLNTLVFREFGFTLKELRELVRSALRIRKRNAKQYRLRMEKKKAIQTNYVKVEQPTMEPLLDTK